MSDDEKPLTPQQIHRWAKRMVEMMTPAERRLLILALNRLEDLS